VLRFAAVLCGLMVLPGVALAAQVTWLGAFAHVPTAYNQSPPATIIGRDGNPRSVPAGYAPLPPYRAETTVREVVRLSAAARSLRFRFKMAATRTIPTRLPGIR
jgi:hypothetical protein